MAREFYRARAPARVELDPFHPTARPSGVSAPSGNARLAQRHKIDPVRPVPVPGMKWIWLQADSGEVVTTIRLRVWPSAHSAFLFGRVPLLGDIADCTDVPMHTRAHSCGAAFGLEIEVAGRRFDWSGRRRCRGRRRSDDAISKAGESAGEMPN